MTPRHVRSKISRDERLTWKARFRRRRRKTRELWSRRCRRDFGDALPPRSPAWQRRPVDRRSEDVRKSRDSDDESGCFYTDNRTSRSGDRRRTIKRLKPNSITLASSELAPNMFGASSELAIVMEFGFYWTTRGLDNSRIPTTWS